MRPEGRGHGEESATTERERGGSPTRKDSAGEGKPAKATGGQEQTHRRNAGEHGVAEPKGRTRRNAKGGL